MNRTRNHHGFTLLELTAVVALLAIVAAVGLARFGQSTLGNLGAQGDARRIALDLLQAQRRAISTGDNHCVQFTTSAGTVTGYRVVRRGGGGDVVVDADRDVPAGVVVTPSQPYVEFTFEGTALAAYQISVAGPNRSWLVSVVPTTGAVRVVEQ